MFPDAWFYVSVKEGGTGSGDTARASVLTSTEAQWYCAHPEDEWSWPAIVGDGNFTIRNW